MICLKRMFVVCGLALCAFQAGATPIATAEIENNLPGLNPFFEFSGSKDVTKTVDVPNLYVYLEADGFDIVSKDLYQTDPLFESVDGASARAELNAHSFLNTVEVTSNLLFADADSRSSMNLTYYVENVKSVSLSLDLDVYMNLSTEFPDEHAYGYMDQYYALYWSNGNSLTLLDDDQFTLSMDVYDGENYLIDEDKTLNLSYNFEDDSPYRSGFLVVRGMTQVVAGTNAPAPANVPEPHTFPLLLLGFGLLAFTWISRKVKAD